MLPVDGGGARGRRDCMGARRGERGGSRRRGCRVTLPGRRLDGHPRRRAAAAGPGGDRSRSARRRRVGHRFDGRLRGRRRTGGRRARCGSRRGEGDAENEDRRARGPDDQRQALAPDPRAPRFANRHHPGHGRRHGVRRRRRDRGEGREVARRGAREWRQLRALLRLVLVESPERRRLAPRRERLSWPSRSASGWPCRRPGPGDHRRDGLRHVRSEARELRRRTNPRRTSISADVALSWTNRPDSSRNAVAPTAHTSDCASTSPTRPRACSGDMNAGVRRLAPAGHGGRRRAQARDAEVER